MQQANLFIDFQPPHENHTVSTFADNLSLPVHRWFRYSAGFSALWVRNLIMQEKSKGRNTVLDPFAGSGTVLLEAQSCNAEAVGIEPHPFVWRVAKTKLYWYADYRRFKDYALSILEQAQEQKEEIDPYPKLIGKCFSPEALGRLDRLRKAWAKNFDESPYSELTWLALASILRECSTAGTAPWQYILPRKQKAKVLDPYAAFETKVYLMSSDMYRRQCEGASQSALLYRADARECPSIPDSVIDLVITSPPYANNYDYADATRLEMSFFGDIQGWGDLQETIRKYLVRSCTQHVAKLNGETYKILDEPILKPIKSEIEEKCRLLEKERENHGGKKPYHTMIAAYFYDMAKMWVELRRITTPNSRICFVIGDSAPYGIHVPVDQWLGKLAMAVGFESFLFEKLRSRNIKWKNRKHRVPLHEGYLWIRG